MTTKLTQETFIKKCNVIHSDKYDYSKVQYIGGDHPITIICPIHGEFTQRAWNHRKGSGCPMCANAHRNDKNRLTTEQYNGLLSERNQKYSPVTLIGEYVNMKTKIQVQCVNNHQWLARPQDILTGHGCKICAVRNREQTCVEKYGKAYYTQHNVPVTTLSKLSNRDWLIDQHHNQQKTLQQIATDGQTTSKCVKSYIQKHNIEHKRFGNSQIERDLLEYIVSIVDTDIITNDRIIIAPQELDVYIPNYKLAIEINGIYWHGELQGRDRNYHKHKTSLCNTKGIRLLQIWDTEWIQQQELVKSRIKNLLNKNITVHARKCGIEIVSKQTTQVFQQQNHIQGYINSDINLGLIFNQELVAVMTFGKSRFNKSIEYELLRFCTKQNYSIIGGASKLHKYFVINYHPKSIISYCDMRYGIGKIYQILGYVNTHNSDPNYFYFKRNQSDKLYSRQSFQKHKLPKKLDIFDPLLTEWENMVNNGYDRIWDCGNGVWVWKDNYTA